MTNIDSSTPPPGSDMMEFCLACYEDRLASVFENSTDLRFYQCDGSEICPAGRLSLPSKDPMDRTSAILARGVKFLVCGAICRRTHQVLMAAGVQVACWRCGEVEKVLQALQNDALDKLAMPGCPGRPCCSLGQGAGWRRGRRAGLSRGDFSLKQRSSMEGEKK